MNKKIRTPHDTFFQTVMEDVKTAVSFFQAHLTAQLFYAIDWSTLTIADTARRPLGQRTLYTDITYQALLKGGKGYIYLHVEHQRKIDQHMLERNFQYNASLFLKHRKQGHKKLPLVVNIVVYNGSQTHYPYHADLYEYFDHPELARSLMSKPYTIYISQPSQYTR